MYHPPITAFIPANDRRSIILGTKIGESEAKKVQEIATAKGLTVSKYLREIVRHHLASQAIESN